ncbi:Multidrug/Oligosaccharidyl-lipid/Polysaccharide (MOP) Flippase Superfamily [Achlya hypogyna]|uniref:Multidrug/Oligosaccharidyl-lipid/Polysaccharide (MOP) Flippase Superfamily n=1 Tax=Achlya hypogyna TaxID=1202772 RepID=A0A1V9ZMC4_ACHHY|nr:Multidrug/Oligosaccharidyl-lipid/Polysaccharide (MOP) Flippase Superfamily [Achlya hypogyna]
MALPSHAASPRYNPIAARSPSEAVTLAIASPEPKDVFWDELAHLCRLAPPVMLTYIFGYLPGVVSLILVGHMQTSNVQLFVGAASLGDMYFNVTGYSIGLGLASAMDTLCSQAYGAGNVKRIGVVFQTGVIVLSIIFIPALLLHLFAADVLIALRQPANVAVLAGQYAAILVIGLPFLYMYELLKKTLQAQNIALPTVYCTVVGNVVNAAVGYALVHHSDTGFLGAAFGRTAANVIMPLSLALHYWWCPQSRAFWPGWSFRRAFAGIGEFLRLGASGMLMMMFEWCSFEFIAVLSGMLPNPIVAIGANAVTVNVYAVVDWMYYGIAVSATVRVGNAVGSNDPLRARVVLKTVLFGAVGLGGVVALVISATRMQYPLIFTHDTAIATLASHVGLVVVAFQLPQAVNQTTQGILRGCGLQSMGAVINFVAYILVGLPLGYLLAFRSGLELAGLWVGMVLAFVVAATIGLGLLRCANLDRISEQASVALWRPEVAHLLRLALPVMGTFILGYLPGVVSLVFVGRMPSVDTKVYIDAASLSDMYFNVTGFSIGLGLASAMDTLASQAFGAGNLKRIGILLQTGTIVLFGAFLPVAALNLYSTDILVALQQPTEVAVLAGPYSRCLLAGLPFIYAYELLKRALQAQNIAWPMLCCTILGNVVNGIVGYALVYHSSLGYLGAAIGRTCACISLPLSLLAYVYWDPKARDIWPGLHLGLALQGVSEFLYFGVPGMLMMMFEWCSFEVIAVLAGVLPNAIVAIGANAVTVNIFSLTDWIYYGLNVSATVRVGNAIGCNDEARARVAIRVVLATALGTALVFATFLLTARTVACVLVLFQIPQGVNQTMQGILRGFGLQNKGAVINLVAYIGVGLPLGYILAFRYECGLAGLWAGMGVGFTLAGSASLLLLQYADYDRVIENKQKHTLDECARYFIVS